MKRWTRFSAPVETGGTAVTGLFIILCQNSPRKNIRSLSARNTAPEEKAWRLTDAGMQVAIGETVEAEKAGLGRRLLSWEEVSGRIHRMLEAGEYAPQEILDGARENALREHAEVLLYMWQDMAGGDIFSDDEIVPGGFPDRKVHMAGLLSQPEYVERLMGKLERLSESYRENRDIMRYHIHRPDQVLERLRKFAKEVSPYQARDGFTGKELPIFITQDEIDAYFCSHGHGLPGGTCFSQKRKFS